MDEILKTLIYFIEMDDYEEVVVSVLSKYLEMNKEKIKKLNITEEEKTTAHYLYLTLRMQ